MKINEKYDAIIPTEKEMREIKKEKALQNALCEISARSDTAASKSLEEWESMRKKMLIEGLARRGEVVAISAPGRVGKSLLTLQLAHDLVEHRDFLSTFKTYAEEGEMVQIYDMEMNMPDAMARIHDVYEACGDAEPENTHMSDIGTYSIRGIKMPFDIFLKIAEDNAKESNACCIIFDSLSTFGQFIKDFDENNINHALMITDGLRKLALNTNSVVVLVRNHVQDRYGRMKVNPYSAGASYFYECDSLIEINRLNAGTENSDKFFRMHFTRSCTPKQAEPIETYFKYPLQILDSDGKCKNMQLLSASVLKNQERKEKREKEMNSIIAKCFEIYPTGFTTVQAQAVREKLGMTSVSNDTMKMHLRNAGLICGDYTNGYKWRKK